MTPGPRSALRTLETTAGLERNPFRVEYRASPVRCVSLQGCARETHELVPSLNQWQLVSPRLRKAAQPIIVGPCTLPLPPLVWCTELRFRMRVEVCHRCFRPTRTVKVGVFSSGSAISRSSSRPMTTVMSALELLCRRACACEAPQVLYRSGLTALGPLNYDHTSTAVRGSAVWLV